MNDWVFTTNPSTSGVPSSLPFNIHSAKTDILFLFDARARFVHKHSLWFLYEKERPIHHESGV